MNEKTRRIANKIANTAVGLSMTLCAGILIRQVHETIKENKPAYAKFADVNSDSLTDIILYDHSDQMKKAYIAVPDSNSITYFEAEQFYANKLKETRCTYEKELHKLDSLKTAKMSELENALRNVPSQYQE